MVSSYPVSAGRKIGIALKPLPGDSEQRAAERAEERLAPLRPWEEKGTNAFSRELKGEHNTEKLKRQKPVSWIRWPLNGCQKMRTL